MDLKLRTLQRKYGTIPIRYLERAGILQKKVATLKSFSIKDVTILSGRPGCRKSLSYTDRSEFIPCPVDRAERHNVYLCYIDVCPSSLEQSIDWDIWEAYSDTLQEWAESLDTWENPETLTSGSLHYRRAVSAYEECGPRTGVSWY